MSALPNPAPRRLLREQTDEILLELGLGLGPHHRAQDGRRRHLIAKDQLPYHRFHRHLPALLGNTSTPGVGDDDDASTLAGEAGAPHTPPTSTSAEIDVSFTGIDEIGYEGVGFAERFGGYELVEAEVTSVGGALPVNPSGGLNAKGRPPGATGVAQCVERFAQLRGEAVNQVDGARVALARRHRRPDGSIGGHHPGRTGQWRGVMDPNGGRQASRSDAVPSRCRPSADCLRCRRTRCGTSSGGRFSGVSFWSSVGLSRRYRWRRRCWWRSRSPCWCRFTLNILLRELGAADLSGAGAAFGAVTQVGPLVTVLIVAGAGATAMCADLGSRTIREEIDAMEVLGIRSGATPGDPSDAGLGFGGPAAQQPGGDHRDPGRLHVLDLHPGCQSGRVRGGHHPVDRGPRGDHLVCEGVAVRVDRRAGGLLPRARRSPVVARRRWATPSTRPWCTRSWRCS